MKMRLKKGKWFAAFRYKGKWKGQALDAYEGEVHKAIINLGKLLQKLERGENPTDLKRKFKDAQPTYFEWAKSEGEKTELTLKDNKGRLKNKILPVFGDLSIGDITNF